MIPAQQFLALKFLSSRRLAPFLAAGLIAAAPLAAFAQTAASGGNSSPGASLYESKDAGAPEKLKGLWLTTEYPELSAQAGEPVSIALDLANKDLPPQRVELGVDGLPKGWKAEIDGGGKQVGAAIAPSDQSVDLSLKLTPPKDADKKAYQFTVTGQADGSKLELPIKLTLAASEPAELTLEPKLPALRGTVRSKFDFQVTIKNEGQKDTVVNLLSKAPDGFSTTFKQQYGQQELTSLPLKAGASKDVSVSVDPPDNAKAGQYPVIVAVSGEDVSAKSQLVLDITGRPELALSGPGGRLSGDATAGEAHSFGFKVENSGTAPAKKVSFSASPPTGWNVDFDPRQLDALPAGKSADVTVKMTPSDKAIAGDYVVAVRADGGGASDSANFRVTVRTATLWGVAGLGVIAAAVVVLGFAVSRYGRR